uniref:Uncharacterized protein n=1 Tax=Ditylenchus dipsaci TaxID=166011 RepID=A0A915DVT8_9BILA
MRNYQYTPDEEAQMDAFGRPGSRLIVESRDRLPGVNSSDLILGQDSLRLMHCIYTSEARPVLESLCQLHANCPRGHATCVAVNNNNAEASAPAATE